MNSSRGNSVDVRYAKADYARGSNLKGQRISIEHEKLHNVVEGFQGLGIVKRESE